MPRLVTAFSNTTVKRLRSLRDKKARREEGLFLAEGLRIIAEARDSGRLPEIIAFSAEGARHPLAAEIIAATEAAGGEAIETDADILAKMSGKDNPQMILAAYRQQTTALTGIDRNAAPIWIVAQALRDPGNNGTVLRTGDAVGSTAIIFREGLRAFSTWPTPVMVPPVPTPEMTMSTAPPVSFQISSAVVTL